MLLASHTHPASHGVVEAPEPDLELELLTATILKPRTEASDRMQMLDVAYELWSSVWKETFQELENRRALPSDDFTRQDELLTLWYAGQCIALTAIRWVNFEQRCFHDDSYFAAWPRSALHAICSAGTKVCIPSYATVAKPWRHVAGGLLKDVLFAIATERCLASGADVIVGTTRNDRGINEVCARNGYRPVAKDLTFHNVSVDLVAFWPKSCNRPPMDATEEAVVQKLLSQLHLGGTREDAPARAR